MCGRFTARLTWQQLHDLYSMPVILDPDDYETWLTAADTAIPQAMLEPFPAQLMTAFPESKRVNSPKNDDAELMAPTA